MSALSGIKFVSTTEINARKESEKEIKALQKEKRKQEQYRFENAHDGEIQRRLRGEHLWVNPALDKRLSGAASSNSSDQPRDKDRHHKHHRKDKHKKSSKKHHKSHKEKKHKHSKSSEADHQHSGDESSSSGSSSDSDNDTVQPTAGAATGYTERMAWMTAPVADNNKAMSAEEASQKLAMLQGSLLAKPAEDEQPLPSSASGGAGSWRARALARAQARAAEQPQGKDDVDMDDTGSTGWRTQSAVSAPPPWVAAPAVPPTETIAHRSPHRPAAASRSPSPAAAGTSRHREVSPSPQRSASRSRSPVRRRSPSPVRRQSRSHSPSPARRSPSPARRRPSPARARGDPTAHVAPTTVAAAITTDPQVPASLDVNKLAAQALRAQMMGNTALHAKLVAQLEQAKAVLTSGARPAADTSAAGDAAASGDNVVVLSGLDARGRPLEHLTHEAPAKHPADAKQGSKRGVIKSGNKYDEEGKRSAYFDDDNATLEELVRRERNTTAGDFDAVFAKNVANMGKSYKQESNSRAGMDEEADFDPKLFQSKESRMTEARRAEKERQRAIAADQRVMHQQSRCNLCFQSPEIKKHLIISLGEHSFLSLPPWGQLVPGHCIIVPNNHIVSTREADEEVYAELNQFKSSLHKMFAAEERDIVFLETSILRQKNRHTYIECVPMDEEQAADAPIFFHKAMMEVEEWTSNKKVVDIAGKGLQRSIPPGFPYVFASWKGGGLVHVIEDEESFPRNFAMDTAAGILGLPPKAFDRASKRLSFEEERQKVMAFLKMWEPFDWTQELEGGEYTE